MRIKNKWKFYSRLTIIIFVIYLLSRLAYSMFIKENTIEVLKYGELSVGNTYEALVVRNENVIRTLNTGDITVHVSEGERVKKGYKIAEILITDLPTNTTDNDEISKDDLKVDIEKLDEKIDLIKTEILQRIQEESYVSIYDLQKELRLNLDKRNKLEEGLNISDVKFNMFKETNVGNTSLSVGSIVDVRSDSAGVVTFTRDGLEDVLVLEQLHTLDYSKILNENIVVSSIENNHLKNNDVVYKIVDNTNWYILVFIDKDENDFYIENKSVSINFGDETTNGTIINKFIADDKVALLISITNTVDGFQKMRRVNVDLVRENFKGLKVPLDSIVKKNGKNGVYALDLERKLKFLPIKEVGYDEEYVIVMDDVFFEDVDGELKRTQTVKFDDEIVRNAQNYSEGDIIY